MRCWRTSPGIPTPVHAASLVNGGGEGERRAPCCPRSTMRRKRAQSCRSWPDTADAAMRAARAGFRAWDGAGAPSEPPFWSAPRSSLKTGAAGSCIFCRWKAAKRWMTGWRSCGRQSIFCRYYAEQARNLFGEAETLPGPTGEQNTLRYRGRGVFVCISPWNFPLAIFLGQVGAALAAGNAVVAKPAEQTPLIAYEAVRLLHQAGVPDTALQLVLGAGETGAALTAHPLVSGVAFTGSTEVAWAINRALAAKRGPIVPLIAETGGINAMIVDATALPEQVVDDAVTSAFRSAGQRCSALRLMAIQEDVAPASFPCWPAPRPSFPSAIRACRRRMPVRSSIRRLANGSKRISHG